MDNTLSPTSSSLFPDDNLSEEDSIWFPSISGGTKCGPLASPSWSEGSSSLSCSPNQYSIHVKNEDILQRKNCNFQRGRTCQILCKLQEIEMIKLRY